MADEVDNDAMNEAMEESDDEAIFEGNEGEAGDIGGQEGEPSLAAMDDEDDDEEHREAKKRQREKLQEIQKVLAAQGRVSGAEEARASRLNYLICQSEAFSHFLTAGGDNAHDLTQMSNDGAPKPRGRGRPGRKTEGRMREDEEDKLLLQTAQAKVKIVRLLKQPSNVQGTMRAYQLEGLNWMIKLFDNNINGILADEMGLGKTLQCISLIAYLREARGITGPHLVVVPKSVCINWIREFKRWCPEIRTVKLQGSKDERKAVLDDQLVAGQFDVAVVSYESLLKESSSLMRFKWKYLVIDEAHRIKNENSALAQMVRKVRSDFRLLITGTPLQNNLHELWALLNFLLPEVFNRSEKFDQWFNTEDEVGRNNTVKRLHTVLQPFLLRRVKADVDGDIPPKTETKLYIGMTATQRTIYTKILLKDIVSLNNTSNVKNSHNKSCLLNMLMQLRKCTNHPYLFDGVEPGPPYSDGPHLWESSGKMVLLDKLLVKLKAQGSRVLIFSQMTRMLDIIEDYMLYKNREGADYDYCRIDGNTSGENREIAMDVFNAPNSSKFCFLLSTRAGGLGINLQTADIVILFDSDWNPQVDLQAMDRAHRIGQTKPVRVFRFVTERSVEEKVIERADKKLFLDAAVIQQGRLAANNQLSGSELMAMCRFGADEIINSKGGTLTNEDIDALLLRGEERTKEMQAKVSQDMQHSLANFSLSDAMQKDEMDLLTFEGENFAGKQTAAAPAFISLPQRERKRPTNFYNVDEYFRSADDDDRGDASWAEPGDSAWAAPANIVPKGVPGTLRVKKYVKAKFPPHCFYEQRIYAIQDIEADLFDQRRQQKILVNKLRIFVPGARRQHIPSDLIANLIEGTNADGDEIVEGHTHKDIPRLLDEIHPPEGKRGKFDLPSEYLEERTAIESRAFGDWDRTHFKSFLQCVEEYGILPDPQFKTRAVEAMAKATGKDPEAVSRYYDVFAARYKELEFSREGRVEDRIKRGNEKVMKSIEVAQRLQLKFDNIGGKVNYSFGARGKYYSEDNDNALLQLVYKHGYGHWQQIQAELRSMVLFQMDWFIQARTEVEISRRCDTVIRYASKEVEKWLKTQELMMKEIANAEQTLAASAARAEAPTADQVEYMQQTVALAKGNLAAHLVPADSYTDLFVLPMRSAEEKQELLNLWVDVEKKILAKGGGSSGGASGLPPAAISGKGAAAIDSAQLNAPLFEVSSLEPYEGPCTAGSSVKSSQSGRRKLILRDHPEVTLDAVMKLLRVGPVHRKPGAGASSSLDDSFGDDAVETSVAANPPTKRSRSPADPSRKPPKKKERAFVDVAAGVGSNGAEVLAQDSGQSGSLLPSESDAGAKPTEAATATATEAEED